MNAPNHKLQPSPAENSIHVHISELILHGIAPNDRYRVGEAVECELARLFLESGIPPALTTSRDVDRINAGTLRTTARPAPAAFGAQVARTVYQRIAGASSGTPHAGGRS